MKRIFFAKISGRAIHAAAVFLLCAAFHLAAAQTSTRVLGTLSAVNGNALTVKADNGVETSFSVNDKTVLKRIEPGQKDLSTAVAMSLAELAQGDRVLVAIDGATTPATALRIIAIKAEDVAAKQRKEAEEWQKNGVGGLVKSVDAATGTIVIASGFLLLTEKKSAANISSRSSPPASSLATARSCAATASFERPGPG